MTVTEPDTTETTTTAKAEWVLRWPTDQPEWGHAWVDHPHRTEPRFCGFLALDDPLVQKAMQQSGSKQTNHGGWSELRTPLDPDTVASV